MIVLLEFIMKLETIVYDARKVAAIRDKLPDFVKEALIIEVPYHRQKTLLEVNAQNHKVVEYLDRELDELISAGQCRRKYHIEIDKKEIPNYDYFYILPVPLEYGKYVFADVKMPSCSKNVLIFGDIHKIYDCSIGSQLFSPVKLKRKKAEKLDIATLNYPWEKEVVLLLSARMKKIFESEGITGLVYEPAQLIKAARGVNYVHANGISHMVYKEVPDNDPITIKNPYIARIPHKINVKVDKISILKFRCKIHSSISDVKFENPRVLKEEIGNVDFFQREGLQAEDRIYPYNNNRFYISRKVLEILLKHNAKGLCQVGVFIKSEFAPMLEISDE